MILSVAQPTDQELNANWPLWIRTLAAAINNLELGVSSLTVTSLTVTAGDTVLVIGTELSSNMIELIIIQGAGAATLSYIRGGTNGQIKIFVFQDDDISFQDGLKSDGAIYLNQLPASSVYNAVQDDVLVLVNIGGDGASTHGYWKELWRQNSVK